MIGKRKYFPLFLIHSVFERAVMAEDVQLGTHKITQQGFYSLNYKFYSLVIQQPEVDIAYPK